MSFLALIVDKTFRTSGNGILYLNTVGYFKTFV
jgi:hypothetical protein